MRTGDRVLYIYPTRLWEVPPTFSTRIPEFGRIERLGCEDVDGVNHWVVIWDNKGAATTEPETRIIPAPLPHEDI